MSKGEIAIDQSKSIESVVVIDIGGTHVRCGGARSGTVLAEVRPFLTDILRAGDPVSTLEQMVRSFAADHGLQDFDLVIGIPATLDRDLDRVLRINNVPALKGLQLRSIFESRFSARVFLEHDTVLQLMGEWFAGSARGVRSVFGVYSGTGVGGAFLFNGEPIRTNTTGVEIGHIPVRSEGRHCICGQTDCLEAYASGRHLIDWSKQYKVPIDRLFIDEDKDPSLADRLEHFLRDKAAAIATAVILTDPELVVLGGGIMDMAGYPVEKLVGMIRNRLQVPEPANSAKFVRSTLGRSAAVHGAMHLILKRGKAPGIAHLTANPVSKRDKRGA
jgi:allose kinase